MQTAVFYDVTNRVLVNRPPLWYNTLNERVLIMEFHEKLQALRKGSGLTQEELAQKLYVSRTAVSKWESGRGYPNIDSLKAIAACFSVTLDQLLSCDEVVSMAQDEQNQKKSQFCDLIFGLLHVSAVLLFVLPCFRQTAVGVLQEVSLLSLTTTAPYLRTVYIVMVTSGIVVGTLLLLLQNYRGLWWLHSKRFLSLMVTALCVLLFIFGTQPYAATMCFIFLIIQVILLFNK